MHQSHYRYGTQITIPDSRTDEYFHAKNFGILDFRIHAKELGTGTNFKKLNNSTGIKGISRRI
jgi:hypothetical protein